MYFVFLLIYIYYLNAPNVLFIIPYFVQFNPEFVLFVTGSERICE